MSTITCATRVANTAPSKCKKELGLILRCVLTPVAPEFTGLDESSAAQTFEEWIEAGINAANAEDRFYPLPMTNGVEDKSTDPPVYTDAMGRQHQITNGVFAFQQKFERDFCLTKRLKNFNGQEFRIIKFDKENAELIEDGDNLKGEKVNVFIAHPKASTPSELSEPTILVSSVDPNEHDERVLIGYDLNLSEMDGLTDIVMNVSLVSTNYVITFTETCGNKDITSELKALSGEKTAWKIDKAGTIANIVAAPTYNASTKTFTAVAATMYAEGTKLKLSDPSILYGLSAGGFEQADWVTLTNPGS